MTSTPSLSNLLDDFAALAMTQLILTFEPDEVLDRENATEEWCNGIARTSYYMAAAMMDARSTFHDLLLEKFNEKKEDEA